MKPYAPSFEVSLPFLSVKPSRFGSVHVHLYLVGGFNLSQKYESVGIIIPNIWKNKSHVPNHQPDQYNSPFQNQSTVGYFVHGSGSVDHSCSRQEHGGQAAREISKLAMDIMWVKQCHKQPMTGNSAVSIPPIKMMTGAWFIIVLPTLIMIWIYH